MSGRSDPIYEVFPLLCLHCGGQMRIIAFITDGGEVKKILDHLGVDSRPPRITPARGPPLWDQQDVVDTFDADVQADLVPESPFVARRQDGSRAMAARALEPPILRSPARSDRRVQLSIVT